MGGSASNARERSGERGRAALAARLVLVRPGEGIPAARSAASFFFILFAYYMLRPLRETFGIERGWEKLPWLMTGTLAAMLAASPLFAWLVSKLPRRRFIPLTGRFFAMNMTLFGAAFLLMPPPHRHLLGYAFYIWLSVFNLFIVSMFWSVMADIWSHEQGTRLFGFIAVGGTLGAIAGAAVTGWVARSPTGEAALTIGLIIAAIVPLELAVQCLKRLLAGPARGGDEPASARFDAGAAAAPGPREPGPGMWEGLRLLAGSPYLALIAAYILLFTIASTLLYVEQGRIVEGAFASPAARTAAFARVDLWVNGLTLVIQLFLSGRIISRFGLRTMLLLLPAISLAGFAALAAQPVFTVLVVFQSVRRGLHYALDRPAREVLFTIVGPDARYKTKSFIDTFIYRAGDMIGGWAPLGLSAAGLALGAASIPLCLAWLAIAALLGASYQRMLRSSGPHPRNPDHRPRMRD
jgi:AAA family ATP:ADP antiporter